MPPWFVAGVVALCISPMLLNLIGIDFSSQKTPFPNPIEYAQMDDSQILEAMFRGLRGALEHTLLEWSAFLAALFTVVLALVHFQIKRDAVTPLIALALFWAGCMDAFHTLAANRLITGTADNRDLIPFTWAICRIFNALIPMLGALFLLYGTVDTMRPKKSFQLVSAGAAAFGLLAYGIIHICASYEQLPQTQFPGAIVTRPFDIIPLFIFAISGFIVYPQFHRRFKSFFAHSLWISVIPDAATQFYMAFGSSSLFDNAFNIAHFLKIISYLVPFMGLLFDTIQIFQREAASKRILQTTRNELDGFIHSASHDLRTPLRGISSFTSFLEEDCRDQLSGEGKAHLRQIRLGVNRMNHLLVDLISLSANTNKHRAYENVNIKLLVDKVLKQVSRDISENHVDVSVTQNLPTLICDRIKIKEVFENLITNAIKFSPTDNSRRAKIEIRFISINGNYEFFVKDNGIGMHPKYHSQVFGLFKRLHTINEFPGTGVGLAIVKMAVESHGGNVRIESQEGQGSSFYFSVPRNLRVKT